MNPTTKWSISILHEMEKYGGDFMNISNSDRLTPEQLSDQFISADNLFYSELFETTELEEVSVEFIDKDEDEE